MAQSDPIYLNIEDSSKPTEIESYCMGCGENGVTRLLLTKVPHFRELILMAFECPHCGMKNNEIRNGSALAEKGVHFECHVTDAADLNRQLVKSDSATVIFKELDLELPPKSGTLTTVEGLIKSVMEDLAGQQPVRKVMEPQVYEKIESVTQQLSDYLGHRTDFHVVVHDPAGNSYIEKLNFPAEDPKLVVSHFERTHADEVALGMVAPDDAEDEDKPEGEAAGVIRFQANCSHCNAPSETRMHLMNIPHFKDVIIMSTACDQCGYKSNEVKSGGAISPQGRRITLKIVDSEDLSRDILKSETCGLVIPEIDLELHAGTLGGRFTTVEGILVQIKEELFANAPFMSGDSAVEDRKSQFAHFLAKLDDVIEGRAFPCTLVLDDPLANSHLQNLYAPDPDPNMTIENYDRTFDQNEDLGLNDIKVEGYEKLAESEAKVEE
ncbi:ZPR1 zinc-finger domain-containing protein [Dimargaris cristalligena]|uniref:ZPR1 zinc-finger domain-containing protein n=1 Tax=Dimargaris cristalligena TaxID=215637 RepID=A0A4P9ZXM3_9FUNG|nr:ZPR1 zinc-finger domain-containing protein [Dimargaris cristalligena]|eukprot:RKP38416.1 ZPR1 zinc-finger domain-containing protein [Dimargaris cristalligena]